MGPPRVLGIPIKTGYELFVNINIAVAAIFWHNSSTMDNEPFGAKRWETISDRSFDEQIVLLGLASLSDFIKGVCEVLHGCPLNVIGKGTFREIPLPSYQDRSGNTVNETLRAQLAETGSLEVTSYRSVTTGVTPELEVTWMALRQDAGRKGLLMWESRWIGDGAEIFVEPIELSEQEQLDFRGKFIEALTRREVQKNKIGIKTARVASKYL